jgi:hypothetical protein
MIDVGYVVLSAVGILGVALSSYAASHPVGHSPLLLGDNVLWDLGFQFGTLAAIAATGIVILHPSAAGVVPIVSCAFVAVTSAATAIDARAVGTMACSQAVIFAAVDNGNHWKWFIVAVAAAGVGVAASGVMVYAQRVHRGARKRPESKQTTETAGNFSAAAVAWRLGFGGGTVLRQRARPAALLGDDPFM